ncbi:MAG: hypothetical protein MUF75_07485 [Bacteroidia bacterium]|jgi:hypothetical protein|nr:hypothetical protein [Bacteroidia bacterium]
MNNTWLLRICILLLLGAIACSFVQDKTPKRVVIKARFDQFTIDNIGNIYTVLEEEIVKYLPNGKFFARYSNLKLGKISSVDATNPLKVLLYYKDFQQLVFLDNQLSVNSNEVSLENLGFEQTELACAGANNSFWIYDRKNNELLRFNENSKKISSTGNLKQILKANLDPNFMREYNGFLYLNCPEQGVYVFDFYGAFSKLIPLKGLRGLRIDEEIIYYRKDSSLCSYNFKLLEEGCKPLPDHSLLKSVNYFKQSLYLAYKDSLVAFTP